MKALVREAMEAGAIGVSTALIYPPAVYAPNEEIAALAEGRRRVRRPLLHAHAQRRRPAARGDRRSAAHRPRGEHARAHLPPQDGRRAELGQDGPGDRADQGGAGGRAAGGRRHLSVHQQRPGHSRAFIHPRHFAEGPEALLRRAGRRRDRERDPHARWRRARLGELVRARRATTGTASSLAGMDDPRYRAAQRQIARRDRAERAGKDPWDMFFALARRARSPCRRACPRRTRSRRCSRSSSRSTPTWARPAARIRGSSAGVRRFPARACARYVRELGVLSLEARSAAHERGRGQRDHGVRSRASGRRAGGGHRDLRRRTIRDRATFAEPDLPSEGVSYVLVNGVVVLEKASSRERRQGKCCAGPDIGKTKVLGAEYVVPPSGGTSPLGDVA